ncbi:MAG: response regulator [Candidatus Promineofilum sp.]|nr:response regulator [Promineifilum sp.]MCW5863012.1 response regulator [Anaerolineae bacterium]
MKTILQIEDNYANTRLVERVLEHQGYRLLHAADGRTGIDIALQEHPDLILLDMGLPDMDGQTLVSVLRGAPELAHTPIVALTAWPEATAAQMAVNYGCDGCITKPINVTEFAEQIAAYLR